MDQFDLENVEKKYFNRHTQETLIWLILWETIKMWKKTKVDLGSCAIWERSREKYFFYVETGTNLTAVLVQYANNKVNTTIKFQLIKATKCI